MKTLALVCAALMTFSASGISMHHAGWFGQRGPRCEGRQANRADPLSSDAAMRYRQSQQTNWRLAMTVR